MEELAAKQASYTVNCTGEADYCVSTTKESNPGGKPTF